MHFNFAVTESQNHRMTEGHGVSSIAPLFQSGAVSSKIYNLFESKNSWMSGK